MNSGTGQLDGRIAKVIAPGEVDPVGVVSQGGSWHRLPAQTSLASMLTLSSVELAAFFVRDHPVIALSAGHGDLLPPVDSSTEIWAAGVTYLQSQQARTHESAVPDVYDRVYSADRPELFFKSIGWRTSGPADPVAVRDDSGWNVPEPELAVVINAGGEIAALTVCNDVSSRSIEGENPLYLPQARVYLGSCSIGPWLVPITTVDPHHLEIFMAVSREDELIWTDRTNTSKLKRTSSGTGRRPIHGGDISRGCDFIDRNMSSSSRPFHPDARRCRRSDNRGYRLSH